MNVHPPYLATLTVRRDTPTFNNSVSHSVEPNQTNCSALQPISALLGMAKRQALSAAHEPTMRRPRNVFVHENCSEEDVFVPSVRAESPDISPKNNNTDVNMDTTESDDGAERSDSSSEEEAEAEFTDGSASYSVSYDEDDAPSETGISLSMDTEEEYSEETVDNIAPHDLYTAFVYVCAVDLLLDGKQLTAAGVYEDADNNQVDQYYRMGEQCLAKPKSPAYQSSCAQEVLQASTFYREHEQFCAKYFNKDSVLHRLSAIVDGALAWEYAPGSTTTMRFTHYNEQKRRFVYRKHEISPRESEQLPHIWFCVNLRMNIKCILFYIMRTEENIDEDSSNETVFRCVQRIFSEHPSLCQESWKQYMDHKSRLVDYCK